jgi:Arylsulfotransferase (ASST)
MSTIGLRRALAGVGALIALSSATTLALASRRIVSEQAAFRAPSAGRCVPSKLNRSAVLPGTGLAVNPLPDSYDSSPSTQISMLGAPPHAIGAIRVVGSESGGHSGRLLGYSQGDGASFLPSHPFRAGETVSVSGEVGTSSGKHRFAYHFVVARQDPISYKQPAHKSAGRDYNEMSHFRSATGLRAPVVVVTTRSPQATPGDIFVTPYSGPGPSGPAIFDEAGGLVWFHPLPSGVEATNLQVQQYAGKPVLTWWQGHIPVQGFGEGEELIADSSYHEIARIHARNGYKADLHDFHLTPGNTALMTVFNPIDCDLSAVGGPRGAAVSDGVLQEVDLRTRLVRREWHSVDHIALSESYSSPEHSSTSWPFDYFHINSIDQLSDGKTMLSARNTWGLYYIDTTSGQVLTRIGGKRSTVKLSSGASTAFQHDGEAGPEGRVTVFDNGAVPKVHPQSRALVLSVDAAAGTDSVVTQFEHPHALLAGSQGNFQTLPNGDAFVGWGSEPYFSEFDPSGQLLYDAHMHGSYESYRTYRFPWTGAPTSAPAIAATTTHAGGPVTVYASWNGDTRTARWQLLAGPSTRQLAPVASAARAGFETSIATPGPERFVAVQALDASGAVLGTSRTIAG